MPCRMLSVAGTGDKAYQLKRSNEFQLEVEPIEIEPNFDDHGNEVLDDSNQVHTTPITYNVDDDDQQHSATRSNQRISATPGYLLTRDREKRIRKPNPK